MNRKIRKSLTWATALLVALFINVTVPAKASSEYGLAPSIQEGVILHCFDWTYAQITAELENIAEAGFTTIQTSPAQYPTSTSGSWYWLYQPLGFYLSDSGPLGTSAELSELCTKAHELGIFVIVDVVANHLCGDHTYIQSDLTDSQYWHSYGSNIDYSNRYAITHGDIGMQDLATENSYVQSCVKSYLKTLLALGVDGFRWDAAKHICLPSESESSQFWPSVTTNLGEKTLLGNEPYHYGEILSSPVSGDWSLFGEYANYIDFTDDEYGNNVLSSFNNGQAYSSYCRLTSVDYIDDEDVVYWAESHDTYSNDGGSSTGVGTNVIDRTWAVVASRNNIPALYFSRPTSSSINMGSKGSTHFTSAEVAAVNHFHNATIGQSDYFVYDNSSNVNAICREGGAVIVLGSGSNASVSVANGGGYTTPGTYTDEISGNTFTVTSSTISGTVGSTGIAVFYTDDTPKMSLSPSGGSFTTETLTITATLNSNATSGTVQVGNGTATSFTGSKSFTIGADMSYGESVTVTWTATNSSKTTTGTATYTKKDPNATIGVYVQAASAPTLYVWTEDVVNVNGAWPGTKMSTTTTVNGTSYYYENFADYDEINIILNDGTGNDSGKTDDITGITDDIFLYYDGATSYTILDVDNSSSGDTDSDSDDNDSGSGDTDDDNSSSTSSVTYYLAGDFNDWLGSTSDSGSTDSGDSGDNGSTDDTTEGITVYVSASSSSYYMYAWYDGVESVIGAWPGTQLSSLNTTTIDGTTYYYYTFTEGSPVYVIFNQGYSGPQTETITVTSDTYFSYNGGTSYTTIASGSSDSGSTDDTSSSDGITVYVNPSSSSYYMYAWYDGVESVIGAWPGTQLSSLNTTTVNGTTYYYYTFTEGSPVYVIFNQGYNGPQTATITVTKDTYFSYSGGTSYTTVSAAAKSAMVTTDNSSVTYDSDYAFVDAGDGTGYLLLELDASLINTSTGFKVYGDDGSEYGYGSTVDYSTDYVYSSTGGETYLTTAPSGTKVTFVIKDAATSSLNVNVIDGEYTSSTGISNILNGADNATIMTSGRTIQVIGTDDVKVYTTTGMLVSTSTATTVQPGIYIVRASGVTKEIVVR